MRGLRAGIVLVSVLACGCLPALAQEGIAPYLEYAKRIEAARRLSALETGLFGEEVSLYNGGTEFSVTDIDVPGNSALPVRLSRRLPVELQPQTNVVGHYDALLRGSGNWEVEVPHLAATYPVVSGNALRCAGEYVPIGWKVPFAFTSGLRYDFDVATSRTASSLRRSVNPPAGILVNPASSLRTVQRQRLYLLASRVEDRFGNTVQFQYNANGHPTRIWANDGREIVLTYSSGRLNTATSHGRTWQYQYNQPGNGFYARLSKVIQPDGSQWNYAYTHDLMPPPSDSEMPSVPWCKGQPIRLDVSWTMTVTHPSGAAGAFNFSNLRHYRSGVHASTCKRSGDVSNPDYQLQAPYFFDVMSLTSKTITGPGVSAMTWSYLYGIQPQNVWGSPTGLANYPCMTCQAEKKVTVTNPDGTQTRHTFGMRYHDNDGRVLKVETLTADGIAIRTETNTWMSEAQATGQPFHAVYGLLLNTFIADPASVRVRPLIQRVIRQDWVDFIWQATAFDSVARPSAVTRSSTLDGNPTRSEATVYWDHLGKWVLGQVGSVTCTAPTTLLPGGCGSSGTQLFQRTYDPVWAVPLATLRFGKLTRLRRSNSASPSGGTLAVDRVYTYNAAQELCRTLEPETGATLMGYDGAGNLAWSAAGMPVGTACHPSGTTAAITPRKVTRTYDARNRLLTLAFPPLQTSAAVRPGATPPTACPQLSPP